MNDYEQFIHRFGSLIIVLDDFVGELLTAHQIPYIRLFKHQISYLTPFHHKTIVLSLNGTKIERRLLPLEIDEEHQYPLPDTLLASYDISHPESTEKFEQYLASLKFRLKRG